MKIPFKKAIQASLCKKRKTEYERECVAQGNAYAKRAALFDQKRMALLAGYESRFTIATVIIEQCGAPFDPCSYKEDILLFLGSDGEPAPFYKEAVAAYFDMHPECMVVYSDEDYRLRGKDLAAFAPISKPCWSPETFFSYNYFGKIFAVRTAVIDETCRSKEADCELGIYDFLLRVTEKTTQIAHMEEVLFHRYAKGDGIEDAERAIKAEDETPGAGEKYRTIKEAACKRRGINATFDVCSGILYPVYQTKADAKVSILIPSKDNPDVLFRLLNSIFSHTVQSNYEIIVVDNGSSDENRKKIEAFCKGRVKYLYHPAEFNFSAMMNRADKEACGDWILLLNDDIEVLSDGWLDVLLGQAMQPGIGAVGAKLLYPNSTVIQHIGVTNAIDGPVHKLIGQEDAISHYRGRNRLVYNVCGVTGACLMVSRELYHQNGGLNEELRVAYNDIDLCFALLERGYRNVVRNDVVLYHHESLSRGHDALSQEKMQRLKQERDYLYKKHPTFYHHDPYEGMFNGGGSDYTLREEYGTNEAKPKELRMKLSKRDYTHLPGGIHVNLERAEREQFLSAAEGRYDVVSGWVVVPEADNCRYQFRLVLMGENQNYEMPMKKYYHADLSEGFPKATNLRLCGFFCYITEGELPKGTYVIGIYAADTCSRQKLFQRTERTLSIE